MQLVVLLYQRKETDVWRVTTQYTGRTRRIHAGTVLVSRNKGLAGIELRSRDRHAKQSGYFIEPSKYITGQPVYVSIPGLLVGFLRSPPLYVQLGRLRGYIDRKPGVQCTRRGAQGRRPIVLNVHADTRAYRRT